MFTPVQPVGRSAEWSGAYRSICDDLAGLLALGREQHCEVQLEQLLKTLAHDARTQLALAFMFANSPDATTCWSLALRAIRAFVEALIAIDPTIVRTRRFIRVAAFLSENEDLR